MIVYFIRHGETDYNKQKLIQGRIDIPLNANGIRQARMTAEHFREKGISFDRVYSSPLCRARNTASLVSGWDLDRVQIDQRIQELDFGVMEGKDYRRLPEKVNNLFVKPQAYEPPEGGESLPALQSRCQSFLDELVSNEWANSNEKLLVATHGAALRGLLSCIDGCSLAEFWKSGFINCTYIKAVWKDGHWQVEEIVRPVEETIEL